jgi:glutathione S-transferase
MLRAREIQKQSNAAAGPRLGGISVALTLHYHPLASFCWKVLIALYENDIPFTPNVVDLSDPTERARLLALSTLGKFPVLQDDTRNEIVPESSIVVEYLDQHYPGRTRLIPADGNLARQIRLCDRFYDLYVHLPMQKIVGDRLRAEGKRDPYGVEEARGQLRKSYTMLDAQMAATGPWAAGASFSLADCAAMPSLFYGNMVEPFTDTYRNLAGYFDRLKMRPSIVRTLEEASPYFSMVPKEN